MKHAQLCLSTGVSTHSTFVITSVVLCSLIVSANVYVTVLTSRAASIDQAQRDKYAHEVWFGQLGAFVTCGITLLIIYCVVYRPAAALNEIRRNAGSKYKEVLNNIYTRLGVFLNFGQKILSAQFGIVNFA